MQDQSRRMCRRLAGLMVCGALAGAAAPAIPFVSASVTSDDAHTFVIAWQAPGVHHVAVYAERAPAHAPRDRKIAAAGASNAGTRIADLPSAPRWYFDLVPDHGRPLLIADRSLHLPGAVNFRDIGGYRTSDGKWVRMGLAYRSNELDRLTPADLDVVGALGLKLICDLRTLDERSRDPDKTPPGIIDVSQNVLADDAGELRALMTPRKPGTPPPTAAQRAATGQRFYADFVRLPSAQAAYHALFLSLADPRQLPLVFHCTAGKDRTGWADAVLLTLLGVPHDVVVSDYELTDHYLQGATLASLQAKFGGTTGALKADSTDLQAAFDEVTRRYGSFDRYLHIGLNLDDATIQRIRANFLAG